jgi:hypothetical protein
VTDFVIMYHPALGNAQALIPRPAANDYETRGWLLVNPNETIPAPVTPYLTKAQADSLYAAAGGGSGAVTPSTLAAAVQSAVDALVGGAPGALNTLNELAAALGDDANFAATVTTALAARATLVGGKVPDNQLPDRLQDLALRAAHLCRGDRRRHGSRLRRLTPDARSQRPRPRVADAGAARVQQITATTETDRLHGAREQGREAGAGLAVQHHRQSPVTVSLSLIPPAARPTARTASSPGTRWPRTTPCRSATTWRAHARPRRLHLRASPPPPHAVDRGAVRRRCPRE